MVNTLDLIKRKIKENKFVVFDLDDTLINEKTWLFASYEKIAHFIFPDDESKKRRAYDFLLKTFENEGRKNIFNKLKEKFPDSFGDIDLWLMVMRQTVVEGGLPIFDWAVKIISKFPSNCIAILTNGNPFQQRKKFEQLYPNILVKNLMLICANEIEAKPSPKGLFFIGKTFGISMENLLFIGDSKTDEECAMRAGVDFIKVEL
jgi:putative hydrolase of the HAD superfamily